MSYTVNNDNGVLFLGAYQFNSKLNYCFASIDTNLPEIQNLANQLVALVNSLLKSFTSVSGGTGILSQGLNSIMTTLDVCLLGFLGSGVMGFIVLLLYTQKLIIGFIT